MVACRAFMLSNMNRLRWIRHADGMYKVNASDGNILRTARSRILVVEMTLRIAWCGMTRLARVVGCNCHLHRLTANKSHGFAEAHGLFWNKLASAILAHPLRILSGDFKLSLWIVAREMRWLGVQTTLAAAFAWAKPCASEAESAFLWHFSWVP